MKESETKFVKKALLGGVGAAAMFSALACGGGNEVSEKEPPIGVFPYSSALTLEQARKVLDWRDDCNVNGSSNDQQAEDFINNNEILGAFDFRTLNMLIIEEPIEGSSDQGYCDSVREKTHTPVN